MTFVRFLMISTLNPLLRQFYINVAAKKDLRGKLVFACESHTGCIFYTSEVLAPAVVWSQSIRTV